MYYCKDLLSLSVLSLYEGELIGVVDKLYFDKKLKKLISLEILNADGVKLILNAKNIYHIGKNAITVKNNQAISIKVEDIDLYPCPIGAKVFSIKGEFLGVVKEINLNDKYLTEKMSLDNNLSLDLKDIASCGKNTVIFYDNKEKIKISKFTPNKTPKTYKNHTVQTAKVMPIEDNKIAEKENEKPKTIQPIENEIKPNSNPADFLIGRVCKKDIFNFNNELLIKAHSIVNKKNLKEINRYGKLRELMLYCK